MKGTVIIVSIFIAGVLIAYYITIPQWLFSSEFQTTILLSLLCLVGIGIGIEDGVTQLFKSITFATIALPFVVILGSLLGGYIAAFVTTSVSAKESLAIASGMGYYSLSSIILSKLSNEQIGTMALIANLAREMSTILFFPLIVRYFGHYGGVASGGATSMDTTLPLIVKHSGKEMAITAIYTGLIITICVPLMISLIMSW